MMFFIPPAILAIEDEDDRSFMENLYRSYYRLKKASENLSEAFFIDKRQFLLGAT